MHNYLSGAKQRLLEFLDDRSGATQIEYALVAGLVSVVIIVAVNDTGMTLRGTYTYLAETMAAAE